MADKNKIEYPIASDGEWVDALCICGDTDSHKGTYCPKRPDPSGRTPVETPDSVVVDGVAQENE